MRGAAIRLAPLLTIAIFSLPNQAAAQRDACHSDVTACFRAHPQRFLDVFALPAAASRRNAGEQVRRVMFFNAFGGGIVAVEFRRAPGQEPEVTLFPVRRPGQPADPPVSAAVPLAEWNRLSAAGRNFARDLVARPPDPVPRDTIQVCADGNLDIVEATDPEADDSRDRLRVRVEGSCGMEDGPAATFADQLADTAVRLIPACQALDADTIGFELLRRCATLAGDRMAAARAFARINRFPSPVMERDRIADLFAAGAGVAWPDGTVEGRAAADRWIAELTMSQTNFLADRWLGETARRVRVTGRLQRWEQVPGGARRLRASVELVLAAERDDDDLQIVAGQVGAFVAD